MLGFLQAIIDCPSTGVHRQSFRYRHLTLTPFRLKKLPRGAGPSVVRKLFDQEGIAEKWASSKWAQKRAAIERRRQLNDFERFAVMIAKKSRRDMVRKSVRAAGKA